MLTRRSLSLLFLLSAEHKTRGGELLLSNCLNSVLAVRS
jgi:hypothetical protein